MIDPIEREEAIKAVWSPQVRPNALIFDALKRAIESKINNIPSADRPQGYWIKTDVATYRCSECGKKQIADDENELNYCCCCGSHNKIRIVKGDHNE